MTASFNRLNAMKTKSGVAMAQRDIPRKEGVKGKQNQTSLRGRVSSR